MVKLHIDECSQFNRATLAELKLQELQKELDDVRAERDTAESFRKDNLRKVDALKAELAVTSEIAQDLIRLVAAMCGPGWQIVYSTPDEMLLRREES